MFQVEVGVDIDFMIIGDVVNSIICDFIVMFNVIIVVDVIIEW